MKHLHHCLPELSEVARLTKWYRNQLLLLLEAQEKEIKKYRGKRNMSTSEGAYTEKEIEEYMSWHTAQAMADKIIQMLDKPEERYMRTLRFDENLVGFIEASLTQNRKSTGEENYPIYTIQWVLVDRVFRHVGLSKLLLNEFIEWNKYNENLKVQSVAMPWNMASRRMHETTGFKHTILEEGRIWYERSGI